MKLDKSHIQRSGERIDEERDSIRRVDRLKRKIGNGLFIK